MISRVTKALTLNTAIFPVVGKLKIIIKREIKMLVPDFAKDKLSQNMLRAFKTPIDIDGTITSNHI